MAMIYIPDLWAVPRGDEKLPTWVRVVAVGEDNDGSLAENSGIPWMAGYA